MAWLVEDLVGGVEGEQVAGGDGEYADMAEGTGVLIILLRVPCVIPTT